VGSASLHPLIFSVMDPDKKKTPGEKDLDRGFGKKLASD